MKPESIENRWDLLYRDYPEVYDRFARVPKKPTAVQVIAQHFPLRGACVVDVGAGTGLSSFELAGYARLVIGVEPEAAMRQVAARRAGELGLENVRFVGGAAEALPLADRSVDAVTAITLASLYSEENILAFFAEAERVIRPGGAVISADLAPGWYGGELAEVIQDDAMRRENSHFDELRSRLFAEHGYAFFDFSAEQDYGSVENAVQTYGFIFGRRAIAHLRRHRQQTIRWLIRVHYKLIA